MSARQPDAMMGQPTRRHLLAGMGAGVATSGLGAVSARDNGDVAADLARYIGHGGKASGGPGDVAVGEWLEGELARAGFTTARQAFDAPYFTPSRTELTSGGTNALVIPQAIVVPTGATGITGPLVRVAPGIAAPDTLSGGIALIDLPAGRWSSALAKPVRATVDAALAVGAKAAVIVTNGPTGAGIALNADGRTPMFAKPVAVLAPRDAAPFFAAAAGKRPATLTIDGENGRRPAFNLVGKTDRGRGRWLVVSTPRSGWFTCAGERGGGIAASLALARWMSRDVTGYDLAFLCNSGHEYENLGASHALAEAAPRPADTRLWLHLGANVAARDWHDLTGAPMPLPSADPQRYFVVSKPLVDPVRRLFRGQPGLEAPYSVGTLAAGELTGIIAAGYTSVAGIFGAHRFHHVADDDARCVDVAATVRAIDALKLLMSSTIESGER